MKGEGGILCGRRQNSWDGPQYQKGRRVSRQNHAIFTISCYFGPNSCYFHVFYASGRLHHRHIQDYLDISSYWNPCPLGRADELIESGTQLLFLHCVTILVLRRAPLGSCVAVGIWFPWSWSIQATAQCAMPLFNSSPSLFDHSMSQCRRIVDQH